MEVNKNDIGNEYYFIEASGNNVICYYGKLISILPKYNFLDDFSSSYQREQNYLFEVLEKPNNKITKAVSDPRYIFTDFSSVEALFAENKNIFLFSYSILAKVMK